MTAKEDTKTFPLWINVRGAYRDVFGNVAQFFKISWFIWVLLLLCVELPMALVVEKMRGELGANPQQTFEQKMSELSSTDTLGKPAPPVPMNAGDAEQAKPEQKKVSMESGLMMMIVNFVQVIILFAFVVAWYRALLLHEKRGETIRFRLTRNEWIFAWTNMKASFAMMPFLLTVALIAMGTAMNGGVYQLVDLVVMAIASVGFLYIHARLCLGYPLSAIGEDTAPLQQSWQLTKNNVLKIIVGNMLVILPMTGALMILAFLLSLLVEMLTATPALTAADIPAVVHEGPSIVKIVQMALKIIGAYFTLFFLATLSAFHARIYATLVRN